MNLDQNIRSPLLLCYWVCIVNFENFAGDHLSVFTDKACRAHIRNRFPQMTGLQFFSSNGCLASALPKSRPRARGLRRMRGHRQLRKPAPRSRAHPLRVISVSLLFIVKQQSPTSHFILIIPQVFRFFLNQIPIFLLFRHCSLIFLRGGDRLQEKSRCLFLCVYSILKLVRKKPSPKKILLIPPVAPNHIGCV